MGRNHCFASFFKSQGDKIKQLRGELKDTECLFEMFTSTTKKEALQAAQANKAAQSLRAGIPAACPQEQNRLGHDKPREPGNEDRNALALHPSTPLQQTVISCLLEFHQANTNGHSVIPTCPAVSDKRKHERNYQTTIQWK